jgi:riboflavin kinase/FMN adenylyltransferase
MRTLVGIGALESSDRGSVVTIGTFDGVHLGHRGLIMQTIDRARELDATSVAITWDRHPAATLRPAAMPALLSSPERKIELLEETGVDMTVVLPFDEEFSQLSPQEFTQRVLVDGLGTRAVFVGHDWRFGHRARGNVDLLTEAGRQAGFEVDGVGLQTVAGEAVSSSRVRRAVADGDVELARVLLGRPYDLDGRVVKGAARGKDLGFPTANLEVDPSLARPSLGIYAGVAHVVGSTKPAAISVGTNPTFGSEDGAAPVTIEAYLLDFEREIYDETVRLEFWNRLRDEMAFDSVDALVAQIEKDVAETRRLLG